MAEMFKSVDSDAGLAAKITAIVLAALKSGDFPNG